jgi:hypothetical protein
VTQDELIAPEEVICDPDAPAFGISVRVLPVHPESVAPDEVCHDHVEDEGEVQEDARMLILIKIRIKDIRIKRKIRDK